MIDETGGSTTNRPEETEPGVTETVQQVASSAADSIQEVASSAADSIQGVASSVADTAQEAASGVVEKVQDVTGAVADQASRVTDAAASQVESLADTVYQQVATPGAPALQRNVAQKTANVLDRTAEYLREGDARLILEDLRGAIRRNPGRSVLLGLAAGYLARSTFFGGSSTQSQGSVRRSQPFTPRSQAVPVYGGDVGMGLDTAYPPAVSGSTLSGDIAAGADLDIPQPSLAASSLDTGDTSFTSFGGGSDTGLDAYGTTTGSGAGDLSESDMQDELASGATLESDDVFVADVDASDQELADETRLLGGEEYRSDASSADTMPPDDLLARWDAEARDRTGEA